MNTHTKARSAPTPDNPDEPPNQERKPVLNLSLTQIAGGALAAMTAAALGSTLGVAGTIAGAALASVVAGVAGSLYTASLRTGHERVRTVFRGRTDAATAPPGPVDPATTIVSDRALDETQVLPDWDPLPLGTADGEPRVRGSFPWKRAVAVSLAVFALAAVLITGYERVTGQPLSGGTGTTVSQVRDDTSGSDTKTKPSPSVSPTSTAPAAPDTPSESASPGVGDTPPASESAESPAPTASESTPESTTTPAGNAGDQGAATPTG